MVQTGKATTFYAPPEFIERYKELLKLKLGVDNLSERLRELAQKDMSNLEGKPVIDNNEDKRTLETRLRALTKEKEDTSRVLGDELRSRLVEISREQYHISFDPPDRAKKAIALMVKDYKAGRLDVDVDRAKFYLFIAYAEISIEYHKVSDRLAELTDQKYSDPALQQEAEQPEAKPAECNQAAEKTAYELAEEEEQEELEGYADVVVEGSDEEEDPGETAV